MKKMTAIMTLALAVLIMPSFVVAQGNQQGSGGQGTPQATPQGTRQGSGAGAGTRGIGSAVQNLTRVAERNNNPEIGQQVREMAKNQEKIQLRTNTALSQMNQRNQAVKLLVGPDYKNAGQVRSDVVGLRNDIKKLETMKGKSLPEDMTDIQEAIEGLQTEATQFESQLAEELEGFSLFGWLAKLLANQ